MFHDLNLAIGWPREAWQMLNEAEDSRTK